MLNIPAIAAKARYQAEADALIARFTTPPPIANARAIDGLVKALKAGDIWPKLDTLWVTAAHDTQAAQRNWISDLYNLTPVGTLGFITNRGYAGDGSASYLTTGYAPGVSAGVATQNSFHLGHWTTSNNATSAVDVGNTNCSINAWTGTSWNGRSMNATSVTFASIPTSVGHHMTSRSASGAVTGYRNGALDSSQSSTSAAPVSDGLFIGARNNAGTPASYTTRRQSVVHAGGALTAADIATLYAALSAYIAALS